MLDAQKLLDLVSSGIRNQEFSLHYQPKIDPKAKRVVAAEALLRWNCDTAHKISIAEIIQLAEGSEVIDEISRWVIKAALSDIERLRTASKDITVSVNISAKNVQNAEFVEHLILTASHLANNIVLELTETVLLEASNEVERHLHDLAQTGFKLSLDDYGAGYSSLTQLQRLPLHEMKLDRQFVSKLATDHRCPLIVRSSIDLAHALEMQIVAEGVEDAETFALLSVMGCDMLQGFFIARPMPLENFIQYLASEDEPQRLKTSARAITIR